MKQSPSWRTVIQRVKNFPRFYGNRVFITVFTRAATGPYRQPDASSPQISIPFP